MTSNIGANYMIDDSLNKKDKEQKVIECLKSTFRPEFINRIDDIIIFEKLNKENIKKIAKISLLDIENRLTDRAIKLNLSKNALDWIVENGFDEIYGVRPLKRLLKRELENKLAYALLKGEIEDNTIINIDADSNGLLINKNIN